MTSTTTPPQPAGNYQTAAEMTRKIDAGYAALRTAVAEKKFQEGATAYKNLATEAIATGLGGVTNQPYAGRLFRGVYQKLDQVVTQLLARQDHLDPEQIDGNLINVVEEIRAEITGQYLMDVPAENEDQRPSEISLDKYRQGEGMIAVRAIINPPAQPAPAPSRP